MKRKPVCRSCSGRMLPVDIAAELCDDCNPYVKFGVYVDIGREYSRQRKNFIEEEYLTYNDNELVSQHDTYKEASTSFDMSYHLLATEAHALRESLDGFWSEHPNYPVKDWAYEVSCDDTRLGYWEWCVCKLEEED